MLKILKAVFITFSGVIVAVITSVIGLVGLFIGTVHSGVSKLSAFIKDSKKKTEIEKESDTEKFKDFNYFKETVDFSQNNHTKAL